MELVNILITGLVIAVLVILYRIFLPASFIEKRKLHKTKQREEEEKMKNSLADPRIYDPSTKTYITLEEAESGIWDIDAISKQMSEKDKEEQFYEIERIAETICEEFLREGFVEANSPLSKEQFKLFEQLRLLDQIDENWGYRNYFESSKITGIILNIHNTFEVALSIPIAHNSGHYIFKEKTMTDRVLDTIRPDDDIEVDHYECFTIQKSKTTRAIENIMSLVNRMKGVEVEVLPYQFFMPFLI